jgi:hypothetical protein
MKPQKKAAKKPIKDLSAGKKARGVKGGGGVFEIKDFTFDIQNPTTVGSATGGAGAGKIIFKP